MLFCLSPKHVSIINLKVDKCNLLALLTSFLSHMIKPESVSEYPGSCPSQKCLSFPCWVSVVPPLHPHKASAHQWDWQGCWRPSSCRWPSYFFLALVHHSPLLSSILPSATKESSVPWTGPQRKCADSSYQGTWSWDPVKRTKIHHLQVKKFITPLSNLDKNVKSCQLPGILVQLQDGSHSLRRFACP